MHLKVFETLKNDRIWCVNNSWSILEQKLTSVTSITFVKLLGISEVKTSFIYTLVPNSDAN